MKDVHVQDVHAVDWNAFNENMLITGSADNSVKLLDIRRIEKRGSSVSSHVVCVDCDC